MNLTLRFKLCLLGLSVFLGGSLSAQNVGEYEIGNLVYSLQDSYEEVLEGEESPSYAVVLREKTPKQQSVIIIPEQVPIEGKNYPVRALGISAFENNDQLTSITLPKTLQSIGFKCFNHCSKLVEIYIPEQVQSLPIVAFQHCSSLQRIEVSPLNSHYSSVDGLLYSHDHQKLLKCPEAFSGHLRLPEETTEIAEQAFQNSQITTLTLPEHLQSIGAYAFSHCHQLQSLQLPESVLYLGDGVFEYCFGLKEVTLSNQVKDLPHYTFNSCTQLKQVALPDNLKTIGRQAFSRCKSLSKIVFKNKLERIHLAAFEYCDSLKEIYAYSLNGPYVENNNLGVENATMHVPNAPEAYYDFYPWLAQNLLRDLPWPNSNIEQPGDPPVGIARTELIEGAAAPIYDLYGRRWQQAQPGLNIIKGKKIFLRP